MLDWMRRPIPMVDHTRDSSRGDSAPGRDADTRVQMKRWVDTWTVAGPMLEDVRVRGLRALTEAEAGRIACDLLWPMVPPGGGDDADGLVRMKDALRRLAPAS
jgi:hypothetical protein